MVSPTVRLPLELDQFRQGCRLKDVKLSRTLAQRHEVHVWVNDLLLASDWTILNVHANRRQDVDAVLYFVNLARINRLRGLVVHWLKFFFVKHNWETVAQVEDRVIERSQVSRAVRVGSRPLVKIKGLTEDI